MKKTDRRQKVDSHGALFIASHWNLWPVLACLMKPAHHNEGHWSYFSFHIHLDISVTAHRASPLSPGEIISLYLVTRYFIGCPAHCWNDTVWNEWGARRWVWTFKRCWLLCEWGRMPNLRPALVNDFPGSAAFLCPYKLRRLQPMFSLMIYPRN